jgi:hypothetical protein
MVHVSSTAAGATRRVAILSSAVALFGVGGLWAAAAGCNNGIPHQCTSEPTITATYSSDNVNIDLVVVVPGATSVDTVSQTGVFGGTVRSSSASRTTLKASITPDVGTPGIVIEASWKCPGSVNSAVSEIRVAVPSSHSAGDSVYASF